MASNSPKGLDGVIEDALCREPMRPVPHGLHARIERRVRITALMEREKREFRGRVLSGLTAAFTLVAVAVVVAVFMDIPGWIDSSVPGAWGYLDYLTLTASQSWLFMGAAAVVVLLLFTVPSIVILPAVMSDNRRRR